MATPMAMPAPHTPQIALTRKMIAVAMHALPSSLGFAGVLCQMPTTWIYCTRARRHWWQNSHTQLQMSRPRCPADADHL